VPRPFAFFQADYARFDANAPVSLALCGLFGIRQDDTGATRAMIGRRGAILLPREQLPATPPDTRFPPALDLRTLDLLLLAQCAERVVRISRALRGLPRLGDLRAGCALCASFLDRCEHKLVCRHLECAALGFLLGSPFLGRGRCSSLLGSAGLRPRRFRVGDCHAELLKSRVDLGDRVNVCLTLLLETAHQRFKLANTRLGHGCFSMTGKVIALRLSRRHHGVTGKRPRASANHRFCLPATRANRARRSPLHHDVGTSHDNAKNRPPYFLVLLQQLDDHCRKLLAVQRFDCFHLYHLRAPLANLAMLRLSAFLFMRTENGRPCCAPTRCCTIPRLPKPPILLPSLHVINGSLNLAAIGSAKQWPILSMQLSIESSKCHGDHRGSEKKSRVHHITTSSDTPDALLLLRARSDRTPGSSSRSPAESRCD
jgi:hypothetical protein